MKKQTSLSIPPIDPAPEAFIHSKRALGLARWYMEEHDHHAHRLSDLVIRKIGGHYALAAYLYYLDKDSAQLGVLPRPSKWVLLDIVTGAVLHVVDCAELDFTDADADEAFSARTDGNTLQDVSDERYREIYKILDVVRHGIIDGRSLDLARYNDYLEQIQKSTPPDYQRFLLELSDPGGPK